MRSRMGMGLIILVPIIVDSYYRTMDYRTMGYCQQLLFQLTIIFVNC